MVYKAVQGFGEPILNSKLLGAVCFKYKMDFPVKAEFIVGEPLKIERTNLKVALESFITKHLH